MTAKRTPTRRPPRRQITPAAIAAFRRMQALASQCTCTSTHRDCPACAGWWNLHSQLEAELRCKVWQFPAIEHPDDKCPYPPSTGAAQWWPQAQALYRMLDAAAREAQSLPAD